MSEPADEIFHATCVAIQGRGVMIVGRSGSGKSDLALRLIDRGARLVSDDYTHVAERGRRLVARAPERIAGRIEMRGVGIVEREAVAEAPLCLVVDLDEAPERLPDGPRLRRLGTHNVPSIPLAALEASAPIKVEQGLLLFGLDPS